MVNQVNIKSLSQVKEIVKVASRCNSDVGVHDEAGAIADAKSILGLMRLDYSRPVKVVSEDVRDLDAVVRAVS